MTPQDRIGRYIWTIRRRFLTGESSATFRGLHFAYRTATDVGYSLARGGGFEQREIDLAIALYRARYADSAPAIVDIGANIGVHSLMFAANLTGASVLAVEPSPSTRGILLRNIANNRLVERVRVIPLALSDRSGTSDFFETSDDAYDSLLDTKRKRVRSMVKVEVARLDDVPEVQEAGMVGLLKIDVEGLEASVIRGAARTIDKYRPLIVAEIYRGTASNPDPEGTVRAIAALGYFPYTLTASGLRPFTSHNDKNYNYFFIPMRPPCLSE